MKGLALGLCFTCFAFSAFAAELRFNIAGDPKTFDPLQVAEEHSEIVRYLTGGALVRVNRVTDTVEPELAESWKNSPDGRAVTFHLRSGLKFSDGTPLTAQDVARTLNTALDPKQASPVGDTFRTEKGNPEIQVTSPLDITIRYPAPRPEVERLFDDLAIVPPSGKASAGAFFVSEYKPGDHVLLARNPYYREKPALDAIRISIQPNHDIEVARFLRGELDLINSVDPTSFDRNREGTTRRRAQSRPLARFRIPLVQSGAFSNGPGMEACLVYLRCVSPRRQPVNPPGRSRPHRLSRPRPSRRRTRFARQQILVQRRTQAADLRRPGRREGTRLSRFQTRRRSAERQRRSSGRVLHRHQRRQSHPRSPRDHDSG